MYTEILETEAQQRFLEDVLQGLSGKQKTLPCKYFYDEKGSQLFEAICGLDEYYVTRTEQALLEEIAPELAVCVGPHARIIEPGSGAGKKIQTLLGALDRPAGYTPIDISEEILHASAETLRRLFPKIAIRPLVADYTQSLQMPQLFGAMPEGKKVVFFPGSTIGNFEPEERQHFLKRIARAVGPGGGLIIGVDLVKDADTLEAAYDDAEGVTAAFNLHILERIKQELGAGVDVAAFSHLAEFNAEKQRVEMHLVSTKAQKICVAGRCFCFAEGETIHTENSYKYTVEGFQAVAREAGFAPQKTWVDDAGLFSIHYLEVAE